jgi:hypothetical protein
MMAATPNRDLTIDTSLQYSTPDSEKSNQGISPVKSNSNQPNAATQTILLGIDTVQRSGFCGKSKTDILHALEIRSNSDAEERLNGWKDQPDTYENGRIPRLTKQKKKIMAIRLGIAMHELRKIMKR